MPVNLRQWIELLWSRQWWRYGQPRDAWFSIPYHVFNLFEGACWVVIGGLVLRRHLTYRRSRLEILYALAFVTFGLTDFREAYALESWLVWAKLANLIALVVLRRIVITRWYPESRVF